MSNSNDEPPKKYCTSPKSPPQPSLSSLPDDIVLRCLVRVPRSYHRNISWVSKDLRSLVRSPELNALRSTLILKSSMHVCLEEEDEDHTFFHWFALNETENGLVLNPTPFPSHPNYGSSTAAVGSNIFFIGGTRRKASTDLWILDTRSGNMTQGPSMTVPRSGRDAAVGVIDGKIYVIGGIHFSDPRFEEEIHVEVFDPKSETWELAGMEKMRKTSRCSASVEGKVYMVEYDEINVYNPRECERGRLVRMVSQRLERGERKDMLKDTVDCVCVVEDVLFAALRWNGIMWFDTKLSVWRRLVGSDGNELMFNVRVKEMSEYDGRLVFFYDLFPTNVLWGENEVDMKKNVKCMLVSLDRAGEKICGTIDWSGTVATVPLWSSFMHCLAVSK